MSNLTLARALMGTLSDGVMLGRLAEINSALTKSDTATVKVADVNKAIRESDDDDVKAIAAAMAKISDEILAKNAEIREFRKSAQAILFPDSVVDDVDTDERNALISEGKELRATIVKIVDAARAAAAGNDENVATFESEIPEIPNVVGVRGRPAGVPSGTAGKPKPRVANISLKGEAKDGSDIDVDTFTKARKEIKASAGVDVDNSVLVDAYLAAASVTDWSDVPSGTVTSVTVEVDSSTGRSVTFEVTAK